MDINNKQDLSNLIEYLEGTSESVVRLPEPEKTDRVLLDDLITYGERHPDSCTEIRRDGSSLFGYTATIDNLPVTLVLLSYDGGGEEGAVLVDGHLQSVDELTAAWMGDVDIEHYRAAWESGNGHAILDYLEIPEDWVSAV